MLVWSDTGLMGTNTAADEIQMIANISAERANLERLHSDYVARQNQVAEPMTDQEFQAASPAKMAQNPAMVEKIFQGSKYYTPDQWKDPEVRRRFNEGIAEVGRRRAEGR
jgi:hypothetical protein